MSTPAKADGGLRFECTQCGLCCTVRGEYACVYINEHECGQLAEFLGSNPKEFKRRFTFVDDQGWRQLNFRQGRCVFLDADERCGVYAARPLSAVPSRFGPN